MHRLQAFQTAAREGGFIELNESGQATVVWLRKSARDTAREMHQRICVRLTNRATVPATVNARTFRVPALQKWFKLRPKTNWATTKSHQMLRRLGDVGRSAVASARFANQGLVK
jgi:hypothetical protein